MFEKFCFVILACVLGKDHSLKLIMNNNCDVMVFASREGAEAWALAHLTPDWSWIIEPFEYAEIET